MSTTTSRRRARTTSATASAADVASKLGEMAAVLVSVTALTACGANFDAQTQHVYQPADGVNNKDSDVYVMGALIVAVANEETEGDGTGTVVARLINSAAESDSLSSVVAADNEGNEITVDGLAEPLEISPGESLQLTEDSPIQLNGDNLKVGTLVTLDFTFENAQLVSVQVPVLPNEGDYAGVTISGPAIID